MMLPAAARPRAERARSVVALGFTIMLLGLVLSVLWPVLVRGETGTIWVPIIGSGTGVLLVFVGYRESARGCTRRISCTHGDQVCCGERTKSEQDEGVRP